eukprot:TRINITY_DN4040_c0_g1_i1.p1 TRINITY_DN4040_c0_g1~~TRINITY_DN4040_c0_g1_i1.p1  ORF type:complete len:179 (-),score=68.31 TRINITY_DN4040_c0_g1_i1:49-585(-)
MDMSPAQCSILLAMGLQYKTVDDISMDLNLPVNQLLALFAKSMRKVVRFLRDLQTKDAQSEISAKISGKSAPPKKSAPIAQDYEDPVEEDQNGDDANGDDNDESEEPHPSVVASGKKSPKKVHQEAIEDLLSEKVPTTVSVKRTIIDSGDAAIKFRKTGGGRGRGRGGRGRGRGGRGN